MSYQVLARKWRPHDFESVVGQEPVVKAITHALRENRLHHAYLFTGTRGVGKTTLSRILAKSLNCMGADGKGGVTDHPCGVCEACRAIDEGRFVDYIEMDAASNRSVEEMTALLEQAMYAPTNARYKVYMIDEVHMLTSHAFNAMLKTLEEPPEYVKFILATTDPQKVPVTVLSRCLQFNLRNVTPQVVASHMQSILTQEGIKAEPAALKLLGVGANGSMRDGLSLLDQAIAYAGGTDITLSGVREMLGVMDTDILADMLKSLAQGKAQHMIELADQMSLKSLSFSQALRDLASMLHRIALAQRIPQTVQSDDLDREVILSLAQTFTPEEVQLYYQIALQARSDLNLAPDEYAGFTMALLRMLAFKPVGSGNLSLPVRAAAPTPIPQKPQEARSAQTASLPMQAKSQAAMPERVAKPMPAVKVGVGEGEPAPWEEGFKGASLLANKRPTLDKSALVKKEPVPGPVRSEALPASAPLPEHDEPYRAEPDEYVDDSYAADMMPSYDDFDARFDFNGEPVQEEPALRPEPESSPAFEDGEPIAEFSQWGRFWYEKLRYSYPATWARDILEHSECVSINDREITLRIEPFYENRTKNETVMRQVQRIIDPLFGRRMSFKFEFSAPQSRTISQHKRLLAREKKHEQYVQQRKGAQFVAIEDEQEQKTAFSVIKNSAEAKILARRFGASVYRPSLKKMKNS